MVNITGNTDKGNKSELFDVTVSNTNGKSFLDVGFGDSGVDAFSRLRVSEPLTLFDSKLIYDNAPLFWDDSQVSGGSTTSTHSVAMASVTLGVGATTAGNRLRQTFQRFNYQPGKSMFIMMTGVLDKSGGGAGITRRIGYYDDNNGVFFEDDAGTAKVVIRTKTSGSVVNNKVAQSSWNLDVFDGTGASGITLDLGKAQIFVIDFEWLGTGRVRFGFVFGGKIVYCHEVLNANVLSNVYMSTPNLPLRYEIDNDGSGVASTLEHICSTVISEGGLSKTGLLRHKDSGSVGSLSSGTTYAVIGLRLKSSHLSLGVLLENLSLLSTTANDQAHWELKLNPTVSGTFTFGDETNSGLQTAVGTGVNVVTGGTDLDGGYFSTALPTSVVVPNSRLLGSQIDGTPDTLVLCCTPITSNITVHGSVTWRELL